jgi:hypothetical protein
VVTRTTCETGPDSYGMAHDHGVRPRGALTTRPVESFVVEQAGLEDKSPVSVYLVYTLQARPFQWNNS